MRSYAPLAPDECALAQAIDLIGDRSTLLVLRQTFFGVHRFDQIHEDTGVPRTVLSARIKKLLKAGILTKRAYREPGRRRRFEYVLTEAGQELVVAFAALMEWGEHHLMGTRKPPVDLFDIQSHQPVTVRFVTPDGQAVQNPAFVRARFARETRTGKSA